MAPKEREPFYREVQFEIRDTSEAGDGRSFSGHAAIFDEPAKITERGRTFVETVRKGAFRKTLNDQLPKLQYAHGRHALLGDLPLGVVTKATEDERGLYIEARLHEAAIFDPVREAVASGALDKMSFRFAAIREKWSADRKSRELLELSVPEVSIVSHPAYAGTSASVREEGQNMTTAEQRRRRVRALLITPPRHRSTQAERAARASQLLGYPPKPVGRGRTVEERIALCQARGIPIDADEIRARADEAIRSPYSAAREAEQRASARKQAKIAARESAAFRASIDSAMSAAQHRAQQDHDRLMRAQYPGTSVRKTPAELAAESYRARVAARRAGR